MEVLFVLGICLGIQWWLEAIYKPYFIGPKVPDSIPVSGTRISWPMAISRYVAPIEARLVRAFLFPFFPADLRVFDLMVRSFPLRGVRVFR